jgi:hypothetical protein
LQLFVVGHGSSPARFQDIEIGAHEVVPRMFKDGDSIPRITHPDAGALARKRTSSLGFTESDDQEVTTRASAMPMKKTKKKKSKRTVRGSRKRNRK